jgi:hypothetical protein
MTITRANAEAVLIKRTGHMLTVAGLDGTTNGGTNADLGDPIAFALRQCGVAVATPATPTTAEVQALETEDQDPFFDLAELRVLETCLQHVLDLVNTEAGSRVDEYSQLANGLRLRIDRKLLQIRAAYGWSAGTIEAGYVYFDFATHGDDE